MSEQTQTQPKPTPKEWITGREQAKKAFKAHRVKQTIKKYALGAAGATAVIFGTKGAAVSAGPVPKTALSSTAFSADGPFDDEKNHQRWPIKTSITSDPSLLTPQNVDIKEFANFPAENPGSVQKFVSTFIPSLPRADLHEGQIVTTEGYVHLVAFEKDDDSDYHIQINDKSTNDLSGLSPCLIVEVPHPAAAANATLAAQFATARKLLRDRCFAGNTPTGTVSPPLHVRVTGQLFYDLSHSGSADPGGGRGKKVGGAIMKATTIWEIHPVTQIDVIDP